MLDGWLGGWLNSCCGVSGTTVTLLDVYDVAGEVAGLVVEVVAEVVLVGTGLTLELRFLRTSIGFGRVVGFVVGFGSSLMSECS